MNVTTENIARVTATPSATCRPRTLEELLNREEALVTRGISQQAELIGGDVLDALNLPLHFRRKPIGTSAIVAGIGLLLAAGARRSRVRRGNRSPGLLSSVRNLFGTTLAGALIRPVGKAAGWIRD